MNAITRHCALVFVAMYGHAPGQSSFNMNLGSGGGETFNNSLVFSAGGVTATVKSWSVSRTGTDPLFARSQVVQWSPGIGSKNSSEVITDTPYVPFYVDNETHSDFMLFIFDTNVNVTSFSMTPSGNNFDTDATYWVGNVSTGIDLQNKRVADLSSLGFGSATNSDVSPSPAVRSVSVSSTIPSYNALLVAARIGGDSGFDRFKMTAVRGVTVVPEPGTPLLCGLALTLALLKRRR